jgi:cell division septum initiation protein DivIVA
MSDRLEGIRARLDAAKPEWDYDNDQSNADVDLINHAPADIAFLLAENEALREQIAFLREEVGDSRLVVKSPQERVWEVWRTTRDEKVATFRTKREATAYIEGGTDA